MRAAGGGLPGVDMADQMSRYAKRGEWAKYEEVRLEATLRELLRLWVEGEIDPWEGSL